MFIIVSYSAAKTPSNFGNACSYEQEASDEERGSAPSVGDPVSISARYRFGMRLHLCICIVSVVNLNQSPGKWSTCQTCQTDDTEAHPHAHAGFAQIICQAG